MTDARFSNQEGERQSTVIKGHLKKVAHFKLYFFLKIGSFQEFSFDRFGIFYYPNEYL